MALPVCVIAQGTCPNLAPWAYAGEDVVIKLPENKLLLYGNNSKDFDGKIGRYAWSYVSGPKAPAISGQGLQTASVSGLIEGRYEFELTVWDNQGASAKDRVVVLVNASNGNVKPIAKAGVDQTITLPQNTVGLDGSASNDADGTIKAYAWQQKSGPLEAIMEGANTVSPVVSGLVEGQFVFELTVTDDSGDKGTDQVTVTVLSPANQAPVADAGSDQSVTLPVSTVQLDGSASNDAEGEVVSYSWQQQSGPATAVIEGADVAVATVSGLVEGVYVFSLTVVDEQGIQSVDEVSVIVFDPANQVVRINAGGAEMLTQDGKVWSADPHPAGSSYIADVSGNPNRVIAGTEDDLLYQTERNDGGQGSFVYELTVPNSNSYTVNLHFAELYWGAPDGGPGGTDRRVFDINVENGQAVVSDYDMNGEVGPLTAIVKSFTGIRDQDGDGKIKIEFVTKVNKAKVAAIEIVPTDDQVSSVPQLAFIENQEVVEGAVVNVPVSAEDADGDPITLSAEIRENGSLISENLYEFIDNGDGTGALSMPTAVGDGGTVCEVRVSATDKDGTDTEEFTVSVKVAGVNEAPVANAGSDQTVTLPVNTVQLDGSASSDAEGAIASYSWQQQSGPATAVIEGADVAVATVSGLVEGVYVFTLTVVDAEGEQAVDEVKVTVKPEAIQDNVVRINAGGAEMLTQDGKVWSADPHPAGSSYIADVSGNPNRVIAGTEDDLLYQTERNDGGLGSFVYELTVPNSNSYTVNLHFAELYWGAPDGGPGGTDRRVFDINVENGQAVVSDYDMNGEVGPLTAIVKSFTGIRDQDGDGKIKIEFVTKVNKAKVAAIEIVPTDDQVSSVPQLAFIENQEVVEGAVVNVPVSAEDADGDPITLSAEIRENGSLISENLYEFIDNGDGTGALSMPTAVGDGGTVCEVRVSATDKDGTDTEEFTVSVKVAGVNEAPVANAGSDQTVTLPVNTVQLDGSASSDAEGAIASYSWQQQSGPATTVIEGADVAVATVSGLVEGVYVFTLTVVDAEGEQAVDEVKVTVKPEAIQDNVVRINAGGAEMLTQDGKVWSADPHPAGSSYIADVSGNPNRVIAGTEDDLLYQTERNDGGQGSFVYELTVPTSNSYTVNLHFAELYWGAPDGGPGGTDRRVFDINVENGQAVVSDYDMNGEAGPLTAIVKSFTGIRDQDGDGKIKIEFVTKVNKAKVAAIEIVPTDDVVPNQSPIADAGSDQTITLPVNTVQLDGTASTDAEGALANYQWTKKSGPVSFNMDSESSSTPLLTGLVEGIYVFELTVTDDKGLQSTDEVSVVVLPQENTSPVANAGDDLTITLPDSSVQLDGSASKDAEGSITYNWKQISGPLSSAIIEGANTATPTASNLTEGVYVFELTVTDEEGLQAKDQVQVTVVTLENQAPIALAGDDIELRLPENETTLNGTASIDLDGTIVSYQWQQVAGPGYFAIEDGETAMAKLSSLVEGQYVFELEVTDDHGAKDSDQIIVTVLPKENQLPVAIAGEDISITLPENAVTLDASASYDTDGAVIEYVWEQTLGSASFTDGGLNASVLSLSDLKEGVYEFSVTVTDDRGAQASDLVRVTVNPAKNLAPVAVAGNDTTLVGATNLLTLDASGSYDEDGEIIEYNWKLISGSDAFFSFVSNEQKPTLVNLPLGQYEFQLAVVDDKGLASQDIVLVSVVENPLSVQVNAMKFITPNGDGIHDTWEIKNLEELGQVSLMIFNRAGHTVYQTDAYNNEWGGIQNGKLLENGDYYYILTGENDDFRSTGGIRIIY
ncbi:malectin domain-containing carbohydrate-binding protein [Rapidithrix thailandica]|uniref:Malectin domain-containing carbohydrate-binding protein n=1 Tax=Rapidithrix thailandica TaxID=413964 RepID=A0AAW9S587_9BACT